MAKSFRDSFKSAVSKGLSSSGSGSPRAAKGRVSMVSTPEVTPIKRFKPTTNPNPKPSLESMVEPTIRAINYAHTMRRHKRAGQEAALKTQRRTKDPKYL